MMITFRTSHRDDFSFGWMLHHVPSTLVVNHSMITRVLILFSIQPKQGYRKLPILFWPLFVSWKVTRKHRAYKIQDFPLKDQSMKWVHYLFNAGVPVPLIDIKMQFSSEIVPRRRANISHYSHYKILFETQIHHNAWSWKCTKRNMPTFLDSCHWHSRWWENQPWWLWTTGLLFRAPPPIRRWTFPMIHLD